MSRLRIIPDENLRIIPDGKSGLIGVGGGCFPVMLLDTTNAAAAQKQLTLK